MSNADAWKEKYLNEFGCTNKVDLDKYPELPLTLYKYVSLSGTLGNELDEIKLKTLENNELFLASNLSFNDPYDCAINMNISNELKGVFKAMCTNQLKSYSNRKDRRESKAKLHQLLKKSDKEADKLAKEIQQNWETFRETIGVCCLSSNYTSQLMWSHYTNSYKGFCIGYDTHKLYESTSLIPVIYSEELTSLKSYIDFNIIDGINEKPNYELAGIHCISKKSPVWEYEHEWRIIDTIEGNGKSIKVPVPSKLYIGCRMAAAHKRRLIDIARKLHIPKIYEIVLNPERFKIEHNRIY